MSFKVAPSRQDPLGAMVGLKPLVMAIEEFQGEDMNKTLEPDVYKQALKLQALKLVCAAARQLGPYLTALANRPVLMDKGLETMYGMNKDEAVEILCHATNAALEAGILGFEEVYAYAYAAYAVRAYVCML